MQPYLRKVISPKPELRLAHTTPSTLTHTLGENATSKKLNTAVRITSAARMLYPIFCMKNGATSFTTSAGRISARRMTPVDWRLQWKPGVDFD